MIWRRSIKRNWMSPLLALCREVSAQCFCLSGVLQDGHQCSQGTPPAGYGVLPSPSLRRLHGGTDHASCLLGSLSITHRLAEWFMLFNGRLLLVRALRAEVIYLCMEPSCTQQCSVWPCMGKPPGLCVRDPLAQNGLVTLWHGCAPGGTGPRPLMLLPPTHGSQPSLEDVCWWSFGMGDSRSPKPPLCLQLLKCLVGWLQKHWSFPCKQWTHAWIAWEVPPKHEQKGRWLGKVWKTWVLQYSFQAAKALHSQETWDILEPVVEVRVHCSQCPEMSCSAWRIAINI